MTVFFHNKEAIDLNAISLMGVSVKTNDNPIGFFGTGLKFALATLLRTGHKVHLHVDGKHIDITSEKENIRGEEFDVVCMDGKKLGFTTRLGRNWKTWQAYREIYCNCVDENGVIGTSIPDGKWGTAFAIDGEDIEMCHRDRHTIFILSDPMFSDATCEIHAGHSQHAFYRGVRAHKHNKLALFTYNVKSTLTLTEDRTVKDTYWLNNFISHCVMKLPDEHLLEQILLAEQGFFEHDLDLDRNVTPSKNFMKTVGRLRHNLHCNRSAIETWKRFAPTESVFEEVELDQFENGQLDIAFTLLRRIDCDIKRNDFKVVKSLGHGVYGSVRSDQILISKQTFDMGVRFIASTLYEEWLHHNLQYADESRELQNLLFEKLFSMIERVNGLEAD